MRVVPGISLGSRIRDWRSGATKAKPVGGRISDLRLGPSRASASKLGGT